MLIPPFAAANETVGEFCGYGANATAPAWPDVASDFVGELRHANITDGTIGYYRFGNSSSGRPPLVMVAGFGMTMGDWGADTVEQLARDQEVIIFDNRGMGESTVC